MDKSMESVMWQVIEDMNFNERGHKEAGLYLINESGTFRATAFRESDPYNIGTDESGQKPYTQGAGLSYQEDFTNIDDFKLIQYFFDIFRPKSKRRYFRKNKNKLTKIDS